MNILPLDRSKLRVLLVEPDMELAREILAGLERCGVAADHASGHLRAMPLFDDGAYQCLVISAQRTDVSGPELCSMIRAREVRRSLCPSYLLLYGRESERMLITTDGGDADEYLIAPWLDQELIWKIERASRKVALCQQALETRLSDPGTGLLTTEGLRAFLYEEVNRVGRRQGWFSLSVLYIPDLGGLRISYGTEWLDWFKSGIWAYLRRQLRNYDRLATMDGGFLCLISPDLDEGSTRALLARLGTAMNEYQLHEVNDTSLRITLAARYLCVRVLGDYKQFGRTGDVLWGWIQERIREPMADGVLGYTGNVALELEYHTESGMEHAGT